MKVTVKQMNVARVENVLTAAACQWVAVFGNMFIQSDMIKSINAWLTDCVVDDKEIHSNRYFAIREGGVEYGTREEVAERCQELGAPVQIVKIEGNGSETATVKIKFL